MFILSAAAFAWNQSDTLRYRWFGDDELRLLALKSDHRLTVANTGDGQLIVLQLEIVSQEPEYRKVIEVLQPIGPGEILSVPIGGEEPASATTPLDRAQWSRRANDAGGTRDSVLIFYDPRSPALAALRNSLDDELMTFEAEGCLHLLAPMRDDPLDPVCSKLIGAPFDRLEERLTTSVTNPAPS